MEVSTKMVEFPANKSTMNENRPDQTAGLLNKFADVHREFNSTYDFVF